MAANMRYPCELTRDIVLQKQLDNREKILMAEMCKVNGSTPMCSLLADGR